MNYDVLITCSTEFFLEKKQMGGGSCLVKVLSIISNNTYKNF